MATISPPSEKARKILVVCTFGGGSHAEPMLVIAEILHARGYLIEFACMEQWQKLAKSRAFISQVHVVTRQFPKDEEDTMFTRMDEQKDGFKYAMTKLDSFWLETYQNLDRVIEQSRPNFIFTDGMDAAGNDIAKKWNIPVASHHAQLPKFIAPASHMPGIHGLQVKCISSEFASLKDRFNEELASLKFILSLKDLMISKKKMRKSAGVETARPKATPDHLMLVNNCFGVELPKSLPPLVLPCGPILSENYSSLDEETSTFLSQHRKVLLVSFGSRVNMTPKRATGLLEGINNALKVGSIDGVIWGWRQGKFPTNQFTETRQSSALIGSCSDFSFILDGKDPHWKITPWVAQRAILAHPSTFLFLSHCGGSSTMEAVYHGVPVISMGIFGDQKANAKRLQHAGVGLQLDKNNFTSEELCEKIGMISIDKDGSFARNVLRLKEIAKLSSKRKHLAADMIEQVLFDHELRAERPIFLETADARMPWLKANNYDMWLLGLLIISTVILAFSYILTIIAPEINHFIHVLEDQLRLHLRSLIATVQRELQMNIGSLPKK